MAGFNNAAMTVAAAALKGVLLGAQLHSAAAGSSGTSNLCSSGRIPVTWGSTTGNGDFGLATQLDFVAGSSGGAVYSITLWGNATSGGTFYGEFVTTGDATFNAAGEYSVTSINHDGTAS
jgi:hypothetical protein